MAGYSYSFTPSCWRLVTLGDMLEDLTPEQRAELPWAQRPDSTIMAKITWSRDACEMMHPEAHNTGTPCWPVGVVTTTSTTVRVGEAVSLAPWTNDLEDLDIIDVDGQGVDSQGSPTPPETSSGTAGQTEIWPFRGQVAVEQRQGGMEALEEDSESETEK